MILCRIENHPDGWKSGLPAVFFCVGVSSSNIMNVGAASDFGKQKNQPEGWNDFSGAGDENRTHVVSLEG